MLLTNTRPISPENNCLNIKLQQFPTLSTALRLERRIIFPIAVKIISTGPIADKPFGVFEVVFAFQTFAPIACIVGMEFMMKTAECVVGVIAGTNVENVTGKIGFRSIADVTIATFRCFKWTLFSAKTAVHV
jgi:hypothetical protein